MWLLESKEVGTIVSSIKRADASSGLRPSLNTARARNAAPGGPGGRGQCAGGQSGSKEPINSREISPSARGPSPPEVLSS